MSQSPTLIRPVTSRRELHAFLTFPWQIYRHDPLWVPPILAERKKQVDPNKGVFFQRGCAEFFTAWQENRMVGTICAAIDFKANEALNKKECVFGFFEVIQDESVARCMLDHVREWAAARGLTSLYGPFNLDYEDGYGILVEGRDRPPAILCGHTPAYYQGFIENYSFKPARGANLAFGRDLRQDMEKLEELDRFAGRVARKHKFNVRSADLSRWREEVDLVYELINPCLQHLPGHTPWQREALQELMAPFVRLADPDLILFAEQEGRVIGFFPALPNFNEVLIHANGLRYPWDALKAWWHSRRPIRSASIKSVLVLPEYWGSGVAILLFAEMARRLREKGYDWVDLSLTSDDNPRTPRLAERVGAYIYKRYQVYRLDFK